MGGNACCAGGVKDLLQKWSGIGVDGCSKVDGGRRGRGRGHGRAGW